MSPSCCTTAAPAAVAASAADSLATLRVRVRRDTVPLEGAIVRSGRAGAPTDATGAATLRLAPGPHAVITARLGFRPDTARLTLRAGQDTAIAVRLAERGAELEAVVVTSTRGERRVEDTPLRVEVIDEDEVAEKVAMTPGDIAMMLNETSGLRVQTTNPSLGGANVRIQGLRGRYSLLLADGLPLYGGQAGGLGLLQIPPVDLGRVEVIKGTASALYGSSALGGVVNLVSRRPGREREGTALVNQTSRGGTDGVAFLAGPLPARWGYTLLAGAHRQRQNDLDGDGWTDMPGYERVVVRPRFYLDDGAGRTAFLTGGVTAEDRSGGTLAGRVLPTSGRCTGRSSPSAAPRSSSATRTGSARCARGTGTARGSARRRSRCRACTATARSPTSPAPPSNATRTGTPTSRASTTRTPSPPPSRSSTSTRPRGCRCRRARAWTRTARTARS
jgi:iron complex outermembrane receptor protein